MTNYCKFCGRPTNNKNRVCDYCEATLCELCQRNLARGYCAVCGRLVCDEDSRMIGFARVCNECIEGDPQLCEPEYLRRFVFRHGVREVGEREFSKVLVFGDFPEEPKYIFIGVDDYDSPYGMCTTYAIAKLIDNVLMKNDSIEFMDYPLLIRLNPNIPFKTRGNAAISLRLRVKDYSENFVSEILNSLQKMPHTFFRKTMPAIAFYVVDDYAVDYLLKTLYYKALRSVLPIKVLLDELSRIKYGYLEIYAHSKYSRGIVGAVASLGAILDDYTYELLVYRKEENYRKRRFIDVKSVKIANEKYYPLTFANIQDDKLLIAPAGPDPVLFGLRGDMPGVLVEFFRAIRHEEHELWCIFRTNQATNSHFRFPGVVEEVYPYETVYIDVEVERVIREEDTVVMEGWTRDRWKVIAKSFRMQRSLQSKLTSMVRGDIIRVGIAVVEKKLKSRVIIGNLEEFIPIKLKPKVVVKNPPCPVCEARLKKKGKNEMYCRKCGFRFKGVFKLRIEFPRSEIKTKSRYHPPPKALRHLTMPNERFYFRYKKIVGLEKPLLFVPFCGRKKPRSLDTYRVITSPKLLKG